MFVYIYLFIIHFCMIYKSSFFRNSLALLMVLVGFLSNQGCVNNDGSKEDYFKIKVIDEETGRGIPMVGLIPLSQQKYYTDSNGFIAFNEPGFMGETVYFEVKSEGYQYAMGKDGKRAVSLHCKAGDSAIVKLTRLNVAERLYRSTGLGIYKDSYLLEENIPIKKPLLNAKVLGQDSNLAAIYKDEVFWVWGDSFLPPEYNGNFSVAAATTPLPKNGGLDPELGMNYKYFENDKGESKPMIQLKDPGYVWFDWLLNIKDEKGNEQLVAKYANVNSFFLNYERGIAVFNDEKNSFERYKKVVKWMPDFHRCEHPFKAKLDDKDYIYLTNEFNFQRVIPHLDSLANPKTYETFTCLKEGTSFNLETIQLDRKEDGALNYSWKKNTDYINLDRQKQLIKARKINISEAWIHLEDVETANKPHFGRGSIFYNEYRKKWVLITGATDIWYAEADTPLGPWVYAIKVAEHLSFLYNPTQHPFLDKDNGKTIFFEGTFTKFFSKEEKVPYYDYNQMLYKLTLNDQQMYLPAPVYKLGNTYQLKESLKEPFDISQIDEIPFFAIASNRKTDGLIPVYFNGKELTLTKIKDEPVFFALPAIKNNEDPFLGIWESKMNFEAFNNAFNLTISTGNNMLKTTTNKSEFNIVKPQVKNDTFFATLKHREGVYYLKATVSARKLNGTWTKKNSTYKGTWEGALTGHKKWWAQFSPSVVNLYVFKNNVTNEIHYSTNKDLKKSGFSRAKKPLCKVWKNPSKNMILDFKTKPIKMPSIY